MNVLTRRTFLLASGAGALVAMAGCAPTPEKGSASPAAGGVMPEEGARHRATWMSLQVDEEVWGEELAPAARTALQDIARTIARYEPVSALVAKGSAGETDLEGVHLVEFDADDLWIRDTGPTFVRTTDGLAGVDFNFNGWGGKQEHDRDAQVARTVCERADVPRIRTELVLEGGALEVDGEGTAIITESCVLNENRNPGWSKQEVEDELERLLGITHVIWLPGIAGKDITDGHTDFYARFARPGVVVAGREDDPESYDYAVTRRHLEILGSAVDAKGRRLDVHVLPGPSSVRPEYANDEFAAGYVNFYVCNGAVIAPQFGDAEADAFAKDTLAELFPDREIVQLDIDPIAAGGGGIHCATQQEPDAR
ncbi:agmatine/peptidylarginine deiminase [uncultured Microbacterium sp.]|uniref:agmatine deiminase family protein n=1 Tax=uncultured Microbacterium sp. TaxID=191216 RepID=UPI0025EDD4EF|nr:agmatine deiminase family protein [uncultured Microbacterium sp.]